MLLSICLRIKTYKDSYVQEGSGKSTQIPCPVWASTEANPYRPKLEMGDVLLGKTDKKQIKRKNHRKLATCIMKKCIVNFFRYYFQQYQRLPVTVFSFLRPCNRIMPWWHWPFAYWIYTLASLSVNFTPGQPKSSWEFNMTSVVRMKHLLCLLIK